MGIGARSASRRRPVRLKCRLNSLGHHTADIAAIAREPRTIEARRDDERYVHAFPPRRGTSRVYAGIASLPVRETACLLCDASPRVKTMSRFVPWALVALCFALGVASRSISDSFVVFVPALQSAFGASRSSITLVYSFALLVGGTHAPVAGRLDRRSLLARVRSPSSASRPPPWRRPAPRRRRTSGTSISASASSWASAARRSAAC